MSDNLLDFDMQIGHKKPETIIHKENQCPFCDREHLTDILATDGELILLRNKYNVLDVLREHIHQLQIMRRMIERDDAEGLTGAFKKANSIQRIIH